MKRILITGAAGFLGRNLTYFLKERYQLVLADQDPERWTNFQLEPHDPNIKIEYADLNEDLFVYAALLDKVDVVIHCANRARIDPSWLEYQQYYQTNISDTQKFFQLCQEHNVKKFIYISSSSVYGNNGQEVQTEDGPLNPSSPYAVSKMAAEWALRVQSQKAWITELIIVRPFTMYGAYMDYSDRALMIPRYMKALVDGNPLFLHGDGLQRRDFVHASDAVQAIELLIEKGQRDEIYNIGSGTSTGIKEIADVVSMKQVKVPDRMGQVRSTLADISKLQKLGYEPKVNVVEWISKQVEQFNQRKKNESSTSSS